MANYPSQIFDTLQRARKSGFSGDIAAGAIGALIVGLPLHLWGPGGDIWGVPMSIIWAGIALVAFTMLALSIFGRD